MAINLTSIDYLDVDGTSDEMAVPMAAGTQYYIKGNVDFFFKIGTTGGVTAEVDTLGSTRCTAGVLYPIANVTDAAGVTTTGFIAIISDGVSGDVDLFREDYS